MPQITVRGAGILGLWQALTLARAGHEVRLLEASSEPFADAASLYGAVMLAPEREAESSPPILRQLGREGIALWREVYPGVSAAGSFVVANARDRADLARFAARTQGHETLDAEALAALEPELGGRFASALLFREEAHMAAPAALEFMLQAVRAAGVDVVLGEGVLPDDRGIVVDARGMAAADELRELRGVRGERAIVRTHEIALSRPVQLLHPRHALYIVPWGDGRFAIGATVIESEDQGPVTVRSALELLGAAYAVHPAFGEAEILDLGAGVRPSFPDNMPRVIVRDEGRRIFVNGAYRHGFLLAPVLARMVAGYIAAKETGPLVEVEA